MGLDYLHRICGIIHTDLKPENVVFEIENMAKLDMLETQVLNTHLVELYEYTEPIILNKRQAKQHKKKERKKKKKAEAAANAEGVAAVEESKDGPEVDERETVGSEAQSSVPQDTEDVEEEKKGAEADVEKETIEKPIDRKSKAEQIKRAFQEQIKKEEEDFKANHVFPIPQRSISCLPFHGKYSQTILMDADMRDAHLFFLHPSNKYKKWVQTHAANDF